MWYKPLLCYKYCRDIDCHFQQSKILFTFNNEPSKFSLLECVKASTNQKSLIRINVRKTPETGPVLKYSIKVNKVTCVVKKELKTFLDKATCSKKWSSFNFRMR